MKTVTMPVIDVKAGDYVKRGVAFEEVKAVQFSNRNIILFFHRTTMVKSCYETVTVIMEGVA